MFFVGKLSDARIPVFGGFSHFTIVTMLRRVEIHLVIFALNFSFMRFAQVQKYIVLTLILLGLPTLLPADTLPLSPHQWFALPSDFELVPVSHPAIRVAARHRKNGFPTLNIMSEVGPFRDAARSAATMQAEILASYAAVGLVQPAVFGSREITLGPSKTFARSFDISYSSGGNSYKATVTVVDQPELRTTITYINTGERWESDLNLREELLARITLPEANTDTQPQPPSNDKTWLILLSLFACFAIGTFYMAKKSRTRGLN